MTKLETEVLLNVQESHVIRKVLASPVFQYLIGAEEWDLTEDDEACLWTIINREIGKVAR